MGIEIATRQDRVKQGKTHNVFRYRWLNDVPLRGGKDALQVNWFEIEIVNRDGEVTYRNSFVTDLPVGPDNVAELAACGRARWKIETRPSMSSRPKDTTSNTISVTASATSPPFW